VQSVSRSLHQSELIRVTRLFTPSLIVSSQSHGQLWDHTDVRNFVGSKAVSGAAQKIVSMLPAHERFVEAFAGKAAVTRLCRPAQSTVLIERDPDTAAQLATSIGARVKVIVGDALEVLQPSMCDRDTVVYCDPPYLMSARSCKRKYYKFDYDDDWHVGFLEWAKSLPCNVLISGYWSQLYATTLQDWRVESFQVQSRGGPRQEYVWCNYAVPEKLHDTRYIGESYIERQRIRRKAARWVKMLKAMPPGERQAILDEVARWHN